LIRGFLAFLLVLLLLSASPASAQGEDPTPNPSPVDAGITIEGTIVNHNQEGLVPEGLSVMLHAWDQSGADRGMIHGESGPNGLFTLENVVVEPGIFYAAMVVYQNATYLSVPHLAEGDNPLEPFEVEIYESTNDLSGVKIDLLHRTVANAVTINDTSEATIMFSLPEDAASVSFPGSSDGRFVSYLGGFADLQPLVPGEGTGRIFVSYILPYEDGITFTREVPLQAESVNLFIPHQSGLSLDPSDVEYIGVKSSSDGESYEHYSLGSVVAEEKFSITLTGAFEVVDVQPIAPLTDGPTINQEILVGAGLLGIGMIFVGIWWWRREDVEGELEDFDPLPDPESER
jgi:hypothetical protein